MRLALGLGYWGAKPTLDMSVVLEAERLGYYSVRAAEAWGSDAVTVLSWVAARTERIRVGSAILQIPARMTAMTAVTLNELSGGRFTLGLGLSGPQVVEGWHGQPFGRPLGKTREYVEIVRTAIAREGPLVFDGTHYQIPYAGERAAGLGKPLKLITHPTTEISIYLASIGPRNVELTAEIADGWLPAFFSPDQARTIFGEHIARGFAASGNPAKPDRFDIVAAVHTIVDPDPDTARAKAKPTIAFYVGGMGARGRNFYNDLTRRYGYEDAATTIQNLYLDGRRLGAIEAVPDELVDEVALVGTKEMVRDRLEAWEESPATTLMITGADIATLRVMAELVS